MSFGLGLLPRCYALVPCAGVGLRAGASGPKQYEPLAGQPLVAHTLRALGDVPRLTATLVVLAPGDRRFRALLPDYESDRGWVAEVGGESRAQTVLAGLGALRERGVAGHDWVLVHDAARCLVRPEWIDRLIDACTDDEVGGLLAMPVADTLKTENDGRVLSTVARQGKWVAQTPQMFRLGLLEPALAMALAEAPQDITDEASAIERLGHAPRLVPGEIENLKITWPADFALAERLLRTRAPGGTPETP